jgi:hypothetical protein
MAKAAQDYRDFERVATIGMFIVIAGLALAIANVI